MTTELTQNKVKELFEYRDGSLFWKIRSAYRIQIGDKVGGTNGSKQPYLRLRIKEHRYLVHRVIYLYHHGYMPDFVDHIDGDIANNNIENLREVSVSQNQLNRKTRSDNILNIKNVRYSKRQKKYAVKLSINKKPKHIGYFKDLELAELVATMAREKYHGEFARNH